LDVAQCPHQQQSYPASVAEREERQQTLVSFVIADVLRQAANLGNDRRVKDTNPLVAGPLWPL